MQADGQSGAAGAGRNKVVTEGGEYFDELLLVLPPTGSPASMPLVVEKANGSFRAVVEPLMRAMLDRGHALSPCRGVRAKLVGDDALGRDALLFQ
jgi:hypothetical protein